MTFEFILEKKDFVTLQLYAASKSASIIKSRKRSRIRIPLVYLFLGLVLYLFVDLFYALLFAGVGVLWYFLFPLYLKKRYIRHYQNHADEHYKNRFGKLEWLQIGDRFIESKDYLGESKLKLEELEEVSEIRDYYFLRFTSGESLIFPKDRMGNVQEFEGWLNQQASHRAFRHVAELDWEWK